MKLGEDVVFFLGAGVSLPAPAGGPLFEDVRDACAKRAGVDPRRGREGDPRFALLEHVIPEVFLKELSDAGYALEEALAAAVSGTTGSRPNPVHSLAARLLAAGGTVWTPNWDTWIEQAYVGHTGTALPVAVYGIEAPPSAAPRFGKLHGSSDRPHSLLFSTPQIMRPLDEYWHRAFVRSCEDRRLFVAGYAGADVDLYPALAEAVRRARAVYWFEGTKPRPGQPPGVPFESHRQAAYEMWRFGLERCHDDPATLPESGRYLVWCGQGSQTSDPSRALLDAFGDASPLGEPPPRDERFAAVDRHVQAAPQRAGTRGRRLLLGAIVRERLGARWSAAARHAGVLVVGSQRQRRKAARSLGNLLLLRAQPVRVALNRAYITLTRSEERASFLVLQAGGVSHDAEAAAAVVADGPGDRSIDACLNLAGSARWSDSLTTAERIARGQLQRALAQDLSSTERDWPERVSRATFEISQSLFWQGRFEECDDICRLGLMRIAGSKWTAWEYSLRAGVRFAAGDFRTADDFLATAIELLHLDGFQDFTRTLFTGRAACHRMLDDHEAARRYLHEAAAWPRKGPGTLAAILAEQAELAAATGDHAAAEAAWGALRQSELPLWKAIAHLRLAERSHGGDHDARAALELFERIGSRWGMIRTEALLAGTTRDDLHPQVAGLGPVDVFVPDAPWWF